jgi:RNA polymerase sigma-70 factor (ECF subfamily)
MGAGARFKGFWATAWGARLARAASAASRSVVGCMGGFRVRVGGGLPRRGRAGWSGTLRRIRRRRGSRNPALARIPPRPALDPSERYDKDVTRLLAQMRREGGDDAAARVFPLVYEQLRELAARQLRRERAGHTLQATALVHEAFLKLQHQHEAEFESRAHMLAVAAMAMRRILVDHAERRRSQKRGGGAGRQEFEHALEVPAPDSADPVDLIALDEALRALAALDERKARVVELRWFAGLSVEEVAEVLALSPATVKRDWEFARVWLLRELQRGSAD